MKTFFLLLILTCTISFSVSSSTPPPLPTPKINPPTINANSYLLIDFNSQKVLTSKNANILIEPASLTKMMTMYIVDNEIKTKKLKLTDKVTISKKAWRAPGSRMFVNVDSKVAVAELIKGIIIQSGNDASIAIAEHIAGSEESFASLMNSYAKHLGMKNTYFTNATGLPDNSHYTTATDLGILATALIRDFPNTYNIYAQKEYTYNGIKQRNRNKLLWHNSRVDGIKTGHTDSAGYCLVASAQNKNMRLISIVLGTKSEDSRTRETKKLLNWGFRFYETHKIYSANKPIQDIRVWMGNSKKVNIGLLEDLYVTIAQGSYSKLNISMQIPKIIKAPLAKETSIGTYRVMLNDEVLAQSPVVALQAVASGKLWSRVKDSIQLTINSLLDKMHSSIPS